MHDDMPLANQTGVCDTGRMRYAPTHRKGETLSPWVTVWAYNMRAVCDTGVCDTP